ncbi:MAG: hypothetical protein OXD43_09710 [Bacteroidetes bacterium]|nr:hypothetical protein [Bacteroidota bacterium]
MIHEASQEAQRRLREDREAARSGRLRAVPARETDRDRTTIQDMEPKTADSQSPRQRGARGISGCDASGGLGEGIEEPSDGRPGARSPLRRRPHVRRGREDRDRDSPAVGEQV